MGRAREAGAAAGQPRSDFGALPRNRGDLRASPHPAQLLASFPPRPRSARPFGAQRRLWGGAWRDVHAPQAVAPTPARLWLRWTGTWTCKKEAGGACGARGVGIHPPHPPPPPPSAPSPALPRREPRPLGRNQRASRFQEPD